MTWRHRAGALALATCLAVGPAACSGGDEPPGGAPGDRAVDDALDDGVAPAREGAPASEAADGLDADRPDADPADGPEDVAADDPEGPEARALAAYRDGQAALSDALGTVPPDPEAPGLAEHFTGAALADSVRIVVEAAGRGEYARTAVTLRPEVASVTGAEVLLTDCLTEDFTTRAVDGDEVVDAGRHVSDLRVRVVREGDAWRVAEITPREATCTP